MKMKIIIIIAVLMMGLGFFANAGSPVIFIKKQTGKTFGNIVVTGNTGGWTKWYWLGVSYKLDNGQEHDIKKTGIFRVKGKYKKNFNIGAMGLFSLAKKSKKITWIVKLWKKKVKKSKCQNPGCRWCMFNGYHFEDSVANVSATGDL
jgi:hypothetical protein